MGIVVTSVRGIIRGDIVSPFKEPIIDDDFVDVEELVDKEPEIPRDVMMKFLDEHGVEYQKNIKGVKLREIYNSLLVEESK